MIRRKLRSVGKPASLVITVPKHLAEILDWMAGQSVDIDMVGKRLIIEKTNIDDTKEN